MATLLVPGWADCDHVEMTELGDSAAQRPPLPMAPPFATAPVVRWHRPAVVSALCCAAAVVLVLVGSFLPLFVAEVVGPGEIGLTFTVTGWDFQAEAVGTSEPTSRNGTVPTNGVPLVLGVAILAFAVRGGTARSRSSYPSSRTATGVAAVTGAAFLAGAVSTVGMQMISWFESFRPTGPLASEPGVRMELTVGVGFWLLIVAVAGAVVAAVLAWVPPRAQGVPGEVDAPRYWNPVVAQLPDRPPPDSPGPTDSQMS